MPTSFGGESGVLPTDQLTVLTAAVALIRFNVPAFEDSSQCFVSDTPWPSVEVHGNLFCTVCPRDGTFATGEAIGAQQDGIYEDTEIQVTVWSKIELDELEHAEAAFSDPERGILPLKKQVLMALAGKQLYDPESQQPLLIMCLAPAASMHPPTRQHEDNYSSFSLTFHCSFNWDLS